MAGTHCVHSGGKFVTLEELDQLPAPEAMGPRHKPIPHGDLVRGWQAAFAANGMAVTKTSLALSGRIPGEGFLTGLFGVKDTRNGYAYEVQDGPNATELTVGFMHDNQQRKPLKAYGGERVFVCDNLALVGEELLIHKRHTTKFDLQAGLNAAVLKFLECCGTTLALFDQLKSYMLSSMAAKELIYDMFCKHGFPRHTLPVVDDLYFHAPQERPEEVPEITLHQNTAYGLYAAFTRAIREEPQHLKIRDTRVLDVPFRALMN